MNEKRIVDMILKIGLLVLVAFLMSIGLSLTVLASSGGSSSSTSTVTNSTSPTNSTATTSNDRPVFNVYGLFEEFLNLLILISPWLCVVIVIFAIRLHVLKERPVMYVTNDDYESVKLGRLVSCEQSKHLAPLWKYRVKKLPEEPSPQAHQEFKKELDPRSHRDEKENKKARKDFMELYCIHPFPVMRLHKWETWNLGIIRWEKYPHYFVSKKPLPQRLWFHRKIVDPSIQNLFIYFLFRISKSRLIHKFIKYRETDEKIKEIYMLQLEYQLDRKYFEFYTTFEKKEYFESQAVQSWVEYPGVTVKSIIIGKDEYFNEEFEPFLKLQKKLKKNRKILLDLEINEKLNASEKKTMHAKIEGEITRLEQMLESTEINDVLLQKYLSIKKELKERKKEQQKLIEHELLSEDDQFYYFTLFQIEDLKRNPQYRKIKRHGDPIPRIRKIKDLNEAIREAHDYREMRSDLELKIAEKDHKIKELQKDYHEERDRNNELELEMESRIEKYFIENQEEKERRIRGKLKFGYRVVSKQEELGYDDQSALIEALRDDLKESQEKTTEMNALKKKVKILEKQNSQLEKKSKEFSVNFEPSKEVEISSMDDVKEMKKKYGNGGKRYF